MFGIGVKKNSSNSRPTVDGLFAQLNEIVDKGPAVVANVLTDAKGKVERINAAMDRLKKTIEANGKANDQVAKLQGDIVALHKEISGLKDGLEEKQKVIERMEERGTTDKGALDAKQKEIDTLTQEKERKEKEVISKLQALISKIGDSDDSGQRKTIRGTHNEIIKLFGDLETKVNELSKDSTWKHNTAGLNKVREAPKAPPKESNSNNVPGYMQSTVSSRRHREKEADTRKRRIGGRRKTRKVKKKMTKKKRHHRVKKSRKYKR